MRKPLISNIQRFCLHDGPGIRTVVFFKGCSLHCPWCSNPENISLENESFVLGANKEELIGKEYSDEALFELLILDKGFYKSDGGITFSGGEPLLFLKDYIPLLKRLKEEKISICVETSLFIPPANLGAVIDYLDFIYIDAKILSKEECKNVLGGDLDVYKKNIECLLKHIARDKIVFRTPLVKPYTNNEYNLNKLKEFYDSLGNVKIEIFSVHNLGKKKYERLGIDYKDFDKIENEELIRIKEFLSNNKNEISINKIS